MRTVGPYAGLVLVPFILWAFLLGVSAREGALAVDFRHFMYGPASDLLAGTPPDFAYPPLVLVLLAPLTLLPRDVASIALTVMLVGCAVATLRVLNVRDWRCYGAAALWAPVFSAVQTGNVSLPLTLAVAVTWRWRDRPGPAGFATALAIGVKLFLWPLACWLAATRRWRNVAVLVATGVGASLAAWALIGFGGLGDFPAAVRDNVRDNASLPYTITAVVRELGGSAAAAYTAAWAVGGTVLVLAIRAAWHGRDAAGFALAIGAALLLSPIVWLHYLSVLLVPVAVAQPTFGWIWLIPLPLWVSPPVGGSVPEKVLVLVTGALMVWCAVRHLPGASGSSPSGAPARSSEPVSPSPGRVASPSVAEPG